MAGWICQTRKMLSAVISSLADDLEQTVQDLNDAIHGLNSTNVMPNTAQPEMNEPVKAVHIDKPLLSSSSKTPQAQQKNQNCSRGNLHSAAAATTRQPETSGLPFATYPELSRSSPSLQSLEDLSLRPTDLEQTDFKTAVKNDPSVVPRLSSNYWLSVSSPCLTDVPVTPPPCLTDVPVTPPPCLTDVPVTPPPCLTDVPVTPPPCLTDVPVTPSQEDVLNIYVPRLLSLDRHPIAQETPSNIRPPHSQHVCPCAQRKSQQMATNCFGLKRPGRVIRAEALPKVEPDLKLPLETNTKLHKTGADIEKSGGCRTEQESSSPALWQSTSLLVVERETRLLRWASPLSNMLLYAVSQLTNLLHIRTEEPQNFQTLTSPDLFSQTIPRNDVKASDTLIINHGHGIARPQSKSDASDSALHDVCESSLPGRTYSTDSFVAIDSSSYYYALDELNVNQIHAVEHGCLPDSGSDACVYSEAEFLELHNDWLDSGRRSSTVCGQASEMMSSSVEWVSFDVGKLVRERHFDARSPVNEGCLEPGQPAQVEQRRRNRGHEDSSQDLCSSGTRDTCGGPMGDCDTDITRDNENDDDGDSSVSIIVLSDLDDCDDEFIFF